MPAREPAQAGNNAVLTEMTEQLPGQFNACYLVMLAWLSRMYEIKDWSADRRERMSIESLATWPLMSMAIRPMLELASCLPLEPGQLFRTEMEGLPMLPVLAQQLRVIYEGKERSEEINRRMDYLALRVLTSVSEWAGEQFAAVQTAGLPRELETLILDWLRSLLMLSDFEKQFSFRIHGGYSSNQPDLEYQLTHPNGGTYAEDPTKLDALFEGSLVLRMRFSGWGLVQLATDPDPPNDEVGCTGTMMLHAADGDRRFDRALVWQPDPARDIVREPRAALPPLGVEVTDLAVMVAQGAATAGYVPLSVMSSLGAVQAQGIQMDLQVQNLLLVPGVVRPEEFLGPGRKLRVNLEEKHGVRPFLNGNNHLTWRDGEPIDPFVLAVLDDKGGGPPAPLFQREIFNAGHALMEMSPLQRASSMRGPVGFDSISNVPDWAMTEAEQRTQATVDTAVSFAERMYLVSQPKGTTVGWLGATLHYGHTVSGPLKVPAGDNTLLAALGQQLGLSLGLAEVKDRNAPNSRWLAHYTLGAMDTDALSNFIYGELYVPLSAIPTDQQLSLSREWRFHAGLQQVLADYALRFDKPFWAGFKVEGTTRTLDIPSQYTIVETLTGAVPGTSYSYSLQGTPGVSDYTGSFSLQPVDGDPEQIRLVWAATFRVADAKAVIAALGFTAGGVQAMTAKLREAFAPH